jgi:hypothetical protein
MRGAEQAILPSATVQTEHPSVKSMQDGLSRTKSFIVAEVSNALSSVAVAWWGELKIGSNKKTTAMRRGAGNPSTRDALTIQSLPKQKDCNLHCLPALKERIWRFGGVVAIDASILWGEMNKPCIALKKIVFSCFAFTL